MHTHQRLTEDVPRPCKPSISVAMLGARMHYAVPAILENGGMLDYFYTDAYVGNKPWLIRCLDFLPKTVCGQVTERLRNRVSPLIPAEKVISYDFLGMWYWWKRRQMRRSGKIFDLYSAVGKAFGKRVVRHGMPSATAVYGFNGAALEIFAYAKPRGIFCILEQCIAPRAFERRLVGEEASLWPGWLLNSERLDRTEYDSLDKREAAEWELADLIISPSEFVANRLANLGVGSIKCETVPYGIPIEKFSYRRMKKVGKDLNLLFVGEIGLRKGVPYLLEALRRLNSSNIKVRLVGPVLINSSKMSFYSNWCEIIGPVPHSKIAPYYRWADAFVFPTVCEGSATVIYEALASGLPVITTPNAGSVLQDGIQGFVVPIRDVEALVTQILRLKEDKVLLNTMSAAAVERAREYSLQTYGRLLIGAISTKRDNVLRANT